MAQAQLNPLMHPSPAKHFFIVLSPELTLKVRQKSGEFVILFYYRNKKSFSLPLTLFTQVANSVEVISLAVQLIRGNLFQPQHGSLSSSSFGFYNAGHCEQFHQPLSPADMGV